MQNMAAVICCLAAFPALAETREGASVVVEADEVISEDLYVTGTDVRILGTVEGDLVAVGGTVELDGNVQGDVLIVAGTAQISGRVLGSVRAVTGQLVLRGKTGEDLSFVSGNALVAASASVGRDVVAVSGMTGIRGPVVRDVIARAGQLDVDARVGGSVRGQVTRLWLGNQALIDGDVVYASPNAMHRSSGAVLNGAVSRQGPEGWSARVLQPVISWLKGLIGLFAFAVLWLTLFPGFSRRAADEVAGRAVQDARRGRAGLPRPADRGDCDLRRRSSDWRVVARPAAAGRPRGGAARQRAAGGAGDRRPGARPRSAPAPAAVVHRAGRPGGARPALGDSCAGSARGGRGDSARARRAGARAARPGSGADHWAGSISSPSRGRGPPSSRERFVAPWAGCCCPPSRSSCSPRRSGSR